ncbi:MAG TPA: hypothetical protein PKE06_07795 [Flavilitoribacter sp.]|nr:hypothetical protein [Flavilitoribacter sp.]HMQ88310.1 hypothetical protein [Flavilitoribacter sp.]
MAGIIIKDLMERIGFDRALTIENFSVVAFFFLNTVFLPAGLLYTTLLTPLFLLFLVKQRNLKGISWYLALSLPLTWFYLTHGADGSTYLRSYILFSSAAIFTIWVYHFLRNQIKRPALYFRTIATYNAIFTGIALLFFLTPAGKQAFWSFEPIHPAIPTIPRLKMLVYEPSFYAFQLAPVVLYYFLSYMFTEGYKYLAALCLLTVSLVFSLSFGVIGGLMIAVLLIILLHFFKLIRLRKLFFATFYLALGLIGLGLAVFYLMPANPLAERIDMIMNGYDTSANGRTWEAFVLAWKILEKTNYLLGAGLGQIKEVGQDIIVNYYNYEGAWADVVRIPNAMAETLATFGILGAAARLMAEIGLFFYTRVYSNYYRFALFIFVFVYQFTGSYLTNIYEYLIWVLVFLPVFSQFNKEYIHNPGRKWKS